MMYTNSYDIFSRNFENFELEKIEKFLYFLKVGELRSLTKKLGLSEKENKRFLVKNIIYFLKYKKIPEERKMPKISKAERWKRYEIGLDELILKGVYKNDRKTKEFFQRYIGAYFHFTAFGIDWINDRWFAGNPPTYKEFIDMWIDEYEGRKNEKVDLKVEWAYMRFSKEHLEKNPGESKSEIIKEWNIERNKNLEFIRETFGDF